MPDPDSNAIEVYLKFITKKHKYPTSMIAVKVGYLPKNSVFKDITRPMIVRLRCSDTHYDLLGRHFDVKVVITPRKLSSKEYYKHAVEGRPKLEKTRSMMTIGRVFVCNDYLQWQG